jgi:putative ABC transport system permease protein
MLARVLISLISGDDADVLRGDLEEAHHRRLAREGDSLRARAASTSDAACSVLHWWRSRTKRRWADARAPGYRGGKMATIGPELRQMFRGLLHRPAYAGMVALTLGLGIGATTTIYSVVDAMLVRPLPYRDADRLTIIGNVFPGQERLEGREELYRLEGLSLPNFRDLRERVRGVEKSAAIERRNWLSASPDNDTEILDVANVEQGFFDLLSVKPFLGRLPRDGDQAAPAGRWGAVITYESWQKRFGGDPNIVGRRFGPFDVIGVLPRDFLQPAAVVGSDVEFWLHLDPDDRRYTDRQRRGLLVLARIQPGVPLSSLRSDLSASQATLATEQPLGNVLPDGKALGIGINSLRDATVGAGERPVLIFLGAALLLLALAGTNAANLLIVRGLERDGELALRRALGAHRSRLVGNLVAESVSLALAGGIIGLAIAFAGVEAFRRFGPQAMPRMGEIAVNLRIVVAGALLSLVVGVLVGVIPAVRSSGADLLGNLRSSLTAISSRGTRVRTFLAATQLALALMLGVGASLLFRSFVHLRSERLGFEPKDRVAFAVAFKNDRPWETWDRVLETLSALPGVHAAAGASSLPFQTAAMRLHIAPVSQDPTAPIAPVAAYSVSPTYFTTAKIPLLRGRMFAGTDQMETRRVAIVNERFAQTTFGARDPVGERLVVQEDGRSELQLEIVGVVGNVVQARVEDGVLPAVYLAHTQMPAPMQVLLHTEREAKELASDIKRAIAGIGLWSAPVLHLSSMNDRIVASRSAPRFQVMLIAAFAGAAVVLAAIGLYGTLTFSVRSRTRELGIRMAMGASRRQIQELVLWQSASVLAIGLGAGLVGALSLTRMLQVFLYRISPIDPLAFLGAMFVVALAVLIATLRPARRASRVDPMTSIRT